MNTKFNSYFLYLVISLLFLFFSSCATHKPPKTLEGPALKGKSQVGYASWYGKKFHGRKTASGETYDMYAMTAAHRTLPFGTQVRVTNLDNQQQTVVKINDRGPFVRGRIIDLSKKAAKEINMIASGTARVKLDVVDHRPIELGPSYVQIASFVSEQNAHQFIGTLAQGVPDLNPRIYNENGYFRIRVGPYPSDEIARKDLDILKKNGFDGFILHP